MGGGWCSLLLHAVAAPLGGPTCGGVGPRHLRPGDVADGPRTGTLRDQHRHQRLRRPRLGGAVAVRAALPAGGHPGMAARRAGCMPRPHRAACASPRRPLRRRPRMGHGVRVGEPVYVERGGQRRAPRRLRHPGGGVAAARGPPRRPTGRNRRCGPHRPVPADTVTVLVGAAIPAGPRVRRRLLWLTPVPLVVSQVLPHVLGTWQTFERYSGRLGTSPTDALVHPWRLVLLVPTAALQLFSWWLPVGFLPLRRPAGLPPQRWARRRCCCRRGAAWPNRGGITVR